MQDSTNYINTLLNAGQQISNSGSLAYADFQRNLIAARADMARQAINAQIQQINYNTLSAVHQANVAAADEDLRKRYLVQDYNTYVGYYNSTKDFMDNVAQGEIQAYVTNAKNINKSAMYNLSRGIVAAEAAGASAKSYFSGSATVANTGSALDVVMNIADQGYNTANQKYAAMLNKANEYITAANQSANNKKLSDSVTNQQMALLKLQTERSLLTDQKGYKNQLIDYKA